MHHATTSLNTPPSRQPSQREAAIPLTLLTSLAVLPLLQQEVKFVDRVRAVCGILNIGNAAALSKEKPAALQAAIAAIKNGIAFRENPFADDVESYCGASRMHD